MAEEEKKATGGKKLPMFALVTPYPLVHPTTKVRFTQNANIEHEEDDWIKAQMAAKLIVKV